jgi:hypothetical protein
VYCTPGWLEREPRVAEAPRASDGASLPREVDWAAGVGGVGRECWEGARA